MESISMQMMKVLFYRRRRRTDQAPVENQIGGGEAEDSNDSEVWGGIGD